MPERSHSFNASRMREAVLKDGLRAQDAEDGAAAELACGAPPLSAAQQWPEGPAVARALLPSLHSRPASAVPGGLIARPGFFQAAVTTQLNHGR